MNNMSKTLKNARKCMEDMLVFFNGVNFMSDDYNFDEKKKLIREAWKVFDDKYAEIDLDVDVEHVLCSAVIASGQPDAETYHPYSIAALPTFCVLLATRGFKL